ncbi:alpha-N-acetylglucosaminidase TIM-barrel domain-containing protein [Microbacterium abyssi]|uniref:alpha-N-acetylglucosaminidase TIM-barrel domain-containing protein n=1 Tax=Microbacterium abyssi TaxID=2782166 RepID=UPI00188825B9|nr:alpha-N-acetylglucosaminidase TIM-barrel domain-containing protein [Microbacterium sp. A18JL241]
MPYEFDVEEAPWADAVAALVTRVTGGLPGRLIVRRLTAPGRRYHYSATAGALTIAATDAVSACVAVHSFLREIAGVAVHWDTALPVRVATIPDVPPVEREARVSQQYIFNFCTFSYTMAHWTWEQWEREIDWMALHGVTLPLAATGHEAVLLDAYRELGLSEQDALRFIGADAYAAFTLMGNLDSAIGSPTREQIDARAQLGRRILDRERSLGMTPVLPAFNGNVPRELFADRVTPREWQGFTTHVLHPGDPAFAEVATAIARAQQARFGTDHLYAADPFIEMLPVDDSVDYPAIVADALLGSLVDVDPDATWVLQSWPFSYQPEFWSAERVRAFLEAIPPNKLIVLDLWAEEDPQWESFDGFFGRPWMWCALLNFGGRSEPIGDVQKAVDEFERARDSGRGPVGLGLTMEATRNNPYFFELVADLAWAEIPDVRTWTARFAVERYGRAMPDAVEAWQALLDTVYSPSGQRVFPEDFLGLMTRRPTTALAPGAAVVEDSVQSLVWFDPARLQQAVALFASAAETNADLVAGPLGHDLADATIAWASRLFDAVAARANRSAAEALGNPAQAKEVLAVIDALDAVLATRPELRLSTWLGGTDGSPSSDEVSIRASRQILTSWNNEPRRQLDDYSARAWHGLLGYYRHRWQAWFEYDGDDLERRLDEVWREFIETGVREAPRTADDITTLTRAALLRFDEIYRTLVRPRGDTTREKTEHRS